MRKSKKFIQKHRYWDFNLDGASDHTRIKDKDKQVLKKQRRRHEKKEANNNVDEVNFLTL